MILKVSKSNFKSLKSRFYKTFIVLNKNGLFKICFSNKLHKLITDTLHKWTFKIFRIFLYGLLSTFYYIYSYILFVLLKLHI